MVILRAWIMEAVISIVDNSGTFIFAVFLFQNGFDYLLTYSDNPQTVFPRYCVSWMVSSGEWTLVYRVWNLC